MSKGITYRATSRTGRTITRYSARHLAPQYSLAVMAEKPGEVLDRYTSRIDLARNEASRLSTRFDHVEIVNVTHTFGRAK